jgi:hypothetical protein
MKDERLVKSDPIFFKLIMYSSSIFALLILLLAIFIEPPLYQRANFNEPVNPAKAAWFLVWIQEIVSYSVYFIYLVIVFFVYFLFLSFFVDKVEYAKWFEKRFRSVQIITFIIFLLIITLTIIAICFRGKNWELIF